MAKTKISEFSATPGNNTDIDSINIAEGCAPSGINDAIRELMAQLKDFQTGAVGDSFNGPVGTTTAAAGAFTTLAASGAVTLSGGTANGIPYLNGSKVLTSGSALTFDGSKVNVTTSGNTGASIAAYDATAAKVYFQAGGTQYIQVGSTASNTFINDFFGAGLSFRMADSEQMRLTSTGLGLGVTSPDRKLHVASTVYPQLRLVYTGVQTYDIGVTSAGTLGMGVAGTQAMTLDASGNFGVGETSIASKLAVTASLPYATVTGSGSGQYGFQLKAGGSDSAGTLVGGLTYNSATGENRLLGPQSYNFLTIYTNNIERARIDSSGNLLVGTTAQFNSCKQGLIFDGATNIGFAVKNSNATTGQVFVGFYNSAGTNIGTITQNATTTVAYNTSSDYRLKENIVPMTGALSKVALLKPVTYSWKQEFGGEDGQGFIAHELQEIVPDCVTGAKDAVDADGNPKYQGIDTSFLVATLTAAIQEQQALIQSLQADVAALKAAA